MKIKNAKKIYMFILKEINGWDDKRLSELIFEEFESDPIFEGLCEIEVRER